MHKEQKKYYKAKKYNGYFLNTKRLLLETLLFALKYFIMLKKLNLSLDQTL